MKRLNPKGINRYCLNRPDHEPLNPELWIFKDAVNFRVSQDDINNGIPGTSKHNPIALAIQRQLAGAQDTENDCRGVWITPIGVWLESAQAWLCEALRVWNFQYNKGEPVQPFTARLHAKDMMIASTNTMIELVEYHPAGERKFPSEQRIKAILELEAKESRKSRMITGMLTGQSLPLVNPFHDNE
ncbi:hypothetical protein C6499_19085 [Candidatus Poribacteria bacterium]|nr:MAG: hypothetical protein C6499_19085 [Candidatus Poribacteria bacterium]